MPRRQSRTQTLLRQLLSGDTAEDVAAEIWELPQHRVPEDQYLDYKRGSLLSQDRRGRADEIRKMVAGFANADGGVLLIGIAGGELTTDRTQWEVTGCNPRDVGAEDLRDWTVGVLATLSPYLAPFPRVEVFCHPQQGPVIAIATERAPQLVPCREAAGVKFYLRVGSRTEVMPPYLHTDLALGRRQRPDIQVAGQFEHTRPSTELTFPLPLTFQIENRGISWCGEGVVEIVGYAATTAAGAQTVTRRLPAGIAGSVDVHPVNQMNTGAVVATCVLSPEEKRSAFERIPPLQRWGPESHDILLPNRINVIKWCGALVVMPLDSVPLWVQLTVTIDRLRGRVVDPEIRALGPAERPFVFYGSIDEWLDLFGSA